jgi:hypothetical protein
VEALKYYLYLKAEESFPDQEALIWYHSFDSGGIEFHIHGIKAEEVAVTKVPGELYEKTLSEFRRNPRGGVFSDLRVGSYLSVLNTMRREEFR